jgi:ribosome-associated protein
MDIRKLQRVIVDGLEDVKAQNIVVFNTEHLSPLFERVIVASGTSNRQTKSLAASVRDAVRAAGEPAPRTEGEDNGEWIIVDCGAAVVHVMQPAIREYYHLEELWGEKPVRMKIGGPPSPRLVKATPVAVPRAVERRASPRPAANEPAAKRSSEGGSTRRTAEGGSTRRSAEGASTRRSTEGASSRRAEGSPVRRGAEGGTTRRGAEPASPTRAPARAPAAKKRVVRTVGVKRPAAKKTASGR